MKEYFLTQLRDKTTGTALFRSAAASLAKIIASEMSSQAELKQVSVQTPLGQSPGYHPRQRIILIPVLRAGFVLLPAFQELFQTAPIGIIGIRRDEETARPSLYYENIPPITPEDRILLLDPMLATGGTATMSVEILKKRGASQITLVTLLAARSGLKTVEKKHPDIRIYTVGIDEHLNDHQFIVPGLGDFGDRYFGTE